MYTLKDAYGFNKKRGHVGIEIEVESMTDLPHVSNKIWVTKKEDSLRGFGMEYITAGPILVDEDKINAIRMVTQAVKESKSKVIEDSPRTSVHVHANVQTLTPTQIWTAATCYWLLEDSLMSYCGKDRIGNKFCLRLRDASALISTCIRDFKRTTPFSSLHINTVKYAGLNLSAVNRFGSLEFRGMRGTLDDSTIDNWSTAVYKLVENAVKHFKSPAEVLDYYYKYGSDTLKAILIDPCLKHSLKVKEDEVEDIAGILCPFAYNHSWSEWESWLEKNKQEAKKAQDQISMPQSYTLGNNIFASGSAPILTDWTEVWGAAHKRSKWHDSPEGTQMLKYKMWNLPVNADWHTLACSYANAMAPKYTTKWYDQYCYKYRRVYLKTQQGMNDGYEDQVVQQQE